MKNLKIIKIKNSERGVSLIITFFIMIIILTVVLSISVLLYSEIKVIRNMSNSMVSFYAADSGIEKVLFYDRQVVPTGAKRGLCSMFDSSGNNPDYCAADISTGNPGDHSIYCNAYPDDLNPLAPQGEDCDPNSCIDCTVKFSTTFDNRTYYTTATVFPNGNFEIDSAGSFGGAQRKIQILTTP